MMCLPCPLVSSLQNLYGAFILSLRTVSILWAKERFLYGCVPSYKFTRQPGSSVQNMNYLGNLKFDVPTLQGDAKKVKDLKNALKVKKEVVAYASTHEKEEEVIAQIHKKLKAKYPNLLTAIILRHPKRKDEVVKMLTNDYGL